MVGPDGFTTTTSKFEFRPAASGVSSCTDYENRITFDEIVRSERNAYRHDGGDDVEPVQFKTTVTLEDLGDGRTRLTWHGEFPTPEERTRVIKEYGADKGLVQNMARLAAFVAALAAK